MANALVMNNKPNLLFIFCAHEQDLKPGDKPIHIQTCALCDQDCYIVGLPTNSANLLNNNFDFKNARRKYVGASCVIAVGQILQHYIMTGHASDYEQKK